MIRISTPIRLAVAPGLLAAAFAAPAMAADPAPMPSDPAVATVVAGVRDWLAQSTTAGRAAVVLDNWKYHSGDLAGAEASALADADWKTVDLKFTFPEQNAASWYRREIIIPQLLGGSSITGRKVLLDLGADDDGIAYINGGPGQPFHWDGGHILLTQHAVPGDRYLVAVKVLNGPGTGGLFKAELSSPDLPAPREAAQDYLDSENFTIWRESQKPSDAAWLKTREAIAAAEILPDSLTAGDPVKLTTQFRRATQDLASPAMRALTDHLVGYAHTDTDWLWEWPETKKTWYGDGMTMLKLMSEFPDFHYSQTQGCLYQAMQQEHPDLFSGIQAAVKKGRWEPLNGWCENDMNMPSGESEIRQAVLSNEYFQQNLGVTSSICWRPDSFGHAWTLPMILKGSGVNSYYFCRAGKGIPIFWWESPDGSRILAFNEPTWYNESVNTGTAQVTVQQTARAKEPNWMTVYGVGDHGGGPTRNDINQTHHLDPLPAFPHLQPSTAAAFFEQLRKDEPKAGYPVISDEMNPTFKGCYTSHVDTKRYNRQLEHALYSAEAWSSVGTLMGRPYPADSLRDAWYDTLRNQFHDILSGSNIHNSYMYAKSRDVIALGKATDARTNAQDTIASEINTGRGQGTPVVVFNPLGWARTDVVRADIAVPLPATGSFQVRDASGATSIASATDAGAGITHVEWVASDVPAVGYRVYWLAPAAQPEITPAASTPGVLENTFFRVNYDPAHGRITGIFDKIHNRDLFQTGGAIDQMQVLFENGNAWDIGPIQSTTPATMAKPPVVETGPDGTQSLVLTDSYDKSTLVHRLILRRGIPRVDFDLDMDWQEQQIPGKGGAFLKTAFDTSVKNPQDWWEIPFGAITRHNDGDESVGLRWMDMDESRAVRSNVPTQTVPLDHFWNGDAFSTASNPKKGSFDDTGMSYPVDIIPQAGSTTFDGMPYIVPDTHSAHNQVVAQGQTIDLPQNGGGDLYFLSAASNGGATGTVTIHYADGTEQTAPMSVSDWVKDDRGLQPAFSADSRFIPSGPDAADKPNIWVVRVPVSKEKPIRSVTLPSDPHIHIFALTIGPKITTAATFGVALLNNGRYGSDMKAGTMRMSIVRSAGDPDPIFDVGRHSLRYSLYPHEGGWQTSGVVQQGWNLNTPLEAQIVTAHGGPLPATGSFLNVSGKGIILTALKRAEDGNGLVVRFYNATDVDTQALVRFNFPHPVRSVHLADMKETEGKSVSMRRQTVTMPVGHSSAVTLRLGF